MSKTLGSAGSGQGRAAHVTAELGAIGRPDVDVVDVEWVEVQPRQIVVADSANAWIYTPAPSGDPFSLPMQGAGSERTTGTLLDGILSFAHSNGIVAAPPPPLTPLRWAWRLCASYHSATATPGGMRIAEQGLRAS